MGTATIVIFVISLSPSFSAITGSETSVLKDITHEVFGKNKDLVPVAFGDFNSDKLTDVIVLNRERNRVSVLISDSATFPYPEMYFKAKLKSSDKKGIECYVNDVEIQSVLPGDFDGDGGMDLVLVVRNIDDTSKNLIVFVLWGDHDDGKKHHKLICPESHPQWIHRIPMSVQPILLDANADETADLFGARFVNAGDASTEEEEERGVWLFRSGRSEPEFVSLPKNEKAPLLKRIHSNAYVDLDADGNSDLFVAVDGGWFEVWIANSKDGPAAADGKLFRHVKDVAVPDCGEGCKVGQVSFADVNMDGRIDVLVPVCYDGTACANSTLLTAAARDLVGVDQPFRSLRMHMGGWKFDMRQDNDDVGLFAPLTARMGDINLDGYPDFLLRLKHPLLPDAVYQTHLFMNLELGDDDDDEGPAARGFKLEESFLRSVKDTHAAAFFDLYEDGTEDIIVVREVQGNLEVGALTNRTKSFDSYFVKVITLSGVCYKNCPGGHIKVPYGTNAPGRTVCYRSHRPTVYHGSITIASCAAQLPQTAHLPLQLPYTIFGLGMSPNFVELLDVNVSNINVSAWQRHHRWTQIIPNSQMYVIPYPTTDSTMWKLKLFITPSKNLIYTALVLLGLCLATIVAILFLHWRERVADKREKLQEANRFHFDAM